MTQRIEDVLGEQYAMFYTDSLDTSQLHPVATLDHVINLVNQCLRQQGKNLSAWPQGVQDEAVRLLNVKRIFQNLQQEPIRKPILFHVEQDKFVVDCGDTRLMALSLTGKPARVSAITTCLKNQSLQFDHWQPIQSNADLIRVTGFQSHAQIYLHQSQDQSHAISWLEIGDQTTMHHMYAPDQACALMQQYIIDQPDSYQFDTPWFNEKI